MSSCILFRDLSCYCYNQQKSKCIYNFPIDLEPNDFRLVPVLSGNYKYNRISDNYQPELRTGLVLVHEIMMCVPF